MLRRRFTQTPADRLAASRCPGDRHRLAFHPCVRASGVAKRCTRDNLDGLVVYHQRAHLARETPTTIDSRTSSEKSKRPAMFATRAQQQARQRGQDPRAPVQPAAGRPRRQPDRRPYPRPAPSALPTAVQLALAPRWQRVTNPARSSAGATSLMGNSGIATLRHGTRADEELITCACHRTSAGGGSTRTRI